MRDLPVVLDGYRLTVVDPPAPKMREDDNGAEVPVTDRDGAAVFVVSLFAKQRAQAGQRAPKGEEIRVSLATDPGMGFDEDVRVELLGPVVNHYAIKSAATGQINAGMSFKATGMKLADGRAVAGQRARNDKDGKGSEDGQ